MNKKENEKEIRKEQRILLLYFSIKRISSSLDKLACPIHMILPLQS
jgi:hypothetical protein